jgi:hypothetical protein
MPYQQGARQQWQLAALHSKKLDLNSKQWWHQQKILEDALM